MQQVGSALGEAQSMRCIRYIARAFRRNHPSGLETLSSCLCIAYLSPVPTNQINQMHSRTHTHMYCIYMSIYLYTIQCKIYTIFIYIYIYIFIYIYIYTYELRKSHDLPKIWEIKTNPKYPEANSSQAARNNKDSEQILALPNGCSQNIQCCPTNNYPEYLEIDILSINSSNFFYSLLPCFRKVVPAFQTGPAFHPQRVGEAGILGIGINLYRWLGFKMV